MIFRVTTKRGFENWHFCPDGRLSQGIHCSDCYGDGIDAIRYMFYEEE